MRTGVPPSKRKVSPPLEALTGRLATLLPTALVRNEMMVPLAAHGGRDEVHAVHLDGGIVRAAGAAEEQDLLALSEDEEVGDLVLERLGVEGCGEDREPEAARQDPHGSRT